RRLAYVERMRTLSFYLAAANLETREQTPRGESGSAQTIPKQCSSLRKGQFVCIKGHACKIVEMSTSKTGKHGHAKPKRILGETREDLKLPDDDIGSGIRDKFADGQEVLV
ncbi:IF5A1-like protein, partial [Mya arenaria]